MKRIALLTLLLAALTTGLAFGGMKGSADVVSAEAKPLEIKAVPGQRVAFDVKVDIQKRWHIYAHEDSNFIGVDLVPSEKFPLKEFQAAYPAGHEKEFFGDMVAMIEGKAVIKATALVPETMAAGEHHLELAVTVQACDDKTCLAPAYLPVTVTLVVE